MKLKRQIVTAAVTDVDVVSTTYDREHGVLVVTFAMRDADGDAVQSAAAVLRSGGSCDAIVRGPGKRSPLTTGTRLLPEGAFARAVAALKAADESAALEAAALDDGWLDLGPDERPAKAARAAKA